MLRPDLASNLRMRDRTSSLLVCRCSPVRVAAASVCTPEYADGDGRCADCGGERSGGDGECADSDGGCANGRIGDAGCLINESCSTGDDDGSIADAGRLINKSCSTGDDDESIADAGCLINESCSTGDDDESMAAISVRDAGCLINESCSNDDDDDDDDGSIAGAGCLINESCSTDGGNGSTALIARLPARLRAFVVRFFTFSSTISVAHSPTPDLADNSGAVAHCCPPPAVEQAAPVDSLCVCFKESAKESRGAGVTKLHGSTPSCEQPREVRGLAEMLG